MKKISDILKELVPKKGKSNVEVAGKLGISSQLLGQYIGERQKPKPEFYKKWKDTFGEDLLKLTETNVSRETAMDDPLPLGDLVVTLGDYFQLLKSQRDSYERIIESGLVKLQNDVTQASVDNQGRASAILEEIRSWNTVILKAVKGQHSSVPPKPSGKSDGKQNQKRLKPGNHKDGSM